MSSEPSGQANSTSSVDSVDGAGSGQTNKFTNVAAYQLFRRQNCVSLQPTSSGRKWKIVSLHRQNEKSGNSNIHNASQSYVLVINAFQNKVDVLMEMFWNNIPILFGNEENMPWLALITSFLCLTHHVSSPPPPNSSPQCNPPRHKQKQQEEG